MLLVLFVLEGLEDFEAFFAGFFSAFFELLGVELSGFFLAFSEAARVRLAASTRLPIPRCSRASCVGVEVEPDIFLSSPAVFVSAVLDSEEEVSLWDSLAMCELGSGAELRPPMRMAAPVPIRRLSFRALHSGQVRFTESLIP